MYFVRSLRKILFSFIKAKWIKCIIDNDVQGVSNMLMKHPWLLNKIFKYGIHKFNGLNFAIVNHRYDIVDLLLTYPGINSIDCFGVDIELHLLYEYNYDIFRKIIKYYFSDPKKNQKENQRKLSKILDFVLTHREFNTVSEMELITGKNGDSNLLYLFKDVLNLQNEDGDTPLMVSMKHNYYFTAFMVLIKEPSINVYIKNKKNQTVLSGIDGASSLWHMLRGYRYNTTNIVRDTQTMLMFVNKEILPDGILRTLKKFLI